MLRIRWLKTHFLFSKEGHFPLRKKMLYCSNTEEPANLLLLDFTQKKNTSIQVYMC